MQTNHENQQNQGKNDEKCTIEEISQNWVKPQLLFCKKCGKGKSEAKFLTALLKQK